MKYAAIVYNPAKNPPYFLVPSADLDDLEKQGSVIRLRKAKDDGSAPLAMVDQVRNLNAAAEAEQQNANA